MQIPGALGRVVSQQALKPAAGYNSIARVRSQRTITPMDNCEGSVFSTWELNGNYKPLQCLSGGSGRFYGPNIILFVFLLFFFNTFYVKLYLPLILFSWFLR